MPRRAKLGRRSVSGRWSYIPGRMIERQNLEERGDEWELAESDVAKLTGRRMSGKH